MLKITNLTAEIDGKQILNGLDLTIEDGKVHAIMGPNGAGGNRPFLMCLRGVTGIRSRAGLPHLMVLIFYRWMRRTRGGGSIPCVSISR